MAVLPYYVGSSLDTIGNNMSRDREMEARAAMAQQQARAQQAAVLQQAMLQRQQMAQQQQQFQQELAARTAQQQQAAQYQNSLLGLKERELTNFGPRDVADQQYRYDALKNALEIERTRANAIDPRLAVENRRQQEINARELAGAQEAWDYNDVATRTKANQYNALVDQIEAEATKVEKKDGWGFDDPESRKIAADNIRRTKYAELMQMLMADRRPGDIAPNPVTRKFEPVLPPRPGGQRINPSGVNPGLANNPVGFRVGTSTATGSVPINAGSGLPDVNTPIKIRASDGKIWDTTAGMFQLFKQRDPGAQIISPSSSPMVNPQPVVSPAYNNTSNVDALLRSLN